MPNRNYQKGRRYEYKEKKIWEERGYLVFRTAGSHSPFDLICIPLPPHNQVILIQLKSGKAAPAIKDYKKFNKLCGDLCANGIQTFIIWYKQKKQRGKTERVALYGRTSSI